MPADAQLHTMVRLWQRAVHARGWLLLALMLLAALLYAKFAMAATFTVTSTGDSGGSTCSSTCTLRQAINAANAAGAGPHTINFNIPGCSSGCTITVTAGSPLPALTRPVTIDGASQPGWSGTPLIRLHGDRYWLVFWYEVTTGIQLAAGSSGSTIRELAFTNFQAEAILVNSSNNFILGNHVGTDLTGNTAVANNTGIWLASGSGNTVGGSSAADRNVISGNLASGVYITSSNNVVVGNYIGLGANGSTALGNGNSGIWLTTAASNNRLGGVNAADANTVAYNANDGITFQSGGSSSGNSLLRNAIHDNALRGIDFNDDGVTPNDTGDGDGGPNNQQNFPVVTSAVTNGITTTVTGSLNSTANTTYRIEFFSSASGDGTGYGEGQVYLGTTTVTTNGSGNATYTQLLTAASTVGHRVSATATVDLGGGNHGSSSEFALNATVALTPAGVTLGTISGNTTEGGGAATFTVVLNRAPTATVTIPVSSSNTTEGSVSPPSLTFTTANWATPQTVTVTGQDETLVDGDRAYTVVLGAATSADAAYNGLNPADVAVTNTDNDTQSTIVVTTSTDVIDGTTTSLYALLTNKGADGQISLREAITAANNSANGSGGPDIINFAVGTGSFSIGLTALLPALSQPVTINGWSQPGYVFSPLVILDCNQLSAYGLWLLAGGGGSTVRGLVVRDCAANAIRIEAGSNGNTIHGNYLGSYGAAGTDQGVGERNLGAGIYVGGANNFIGGGGTAQGNVIGGNQSHGVHISGATATGNLVQGNYVGLNAAGTAAVANTSDGIRVDSSATGNTIGTNLDGSNDATEGNVVSGNGGVGIIVGANNTTVRGNFVGLLPDGNTKVANGSYGIDVLAFVTGATIGSGAVGGGNVISGNGNAGILFEVGSSGTVKGNFVGTNAAGSSVISGIGAALFIATSNVQVGGTTAAEGNIFAGSNTDGIIVSGVTSNSNAILGNRIHSNSGLGIDLADDGVSANDGGDGDTGPNNLQNTPLLTAAAVNSSGTQVTVSGSLNAVANTNFRIEFFANSAADPSGSGEGQRLLGSANVSTDGSGNASFSALLTASATVGEHVTATATRANAGYTVYSDTSEFAANVVAVAAGHAITGTVYEDVNYGGGAGRTLAASSGAGIGGATVELYSPDTGLVASTTTDGSGAYAFNGITNGGYFVRVVLGTVSSTRSGSVGGLQPVQTWRYEASQLTPGAVTNEVGGARPEVADSGAAAALSWSACASEGGSCAFTGTRLVRYGASPNFTTRVATGGVACNNTIFGDPAMGIGKSCAVLQPHLHSASSVQVNNAAVSGVHFGYNFSTVTHTNDSGAGSLRQVITNANALGNAGLAQSGRTADIENIVFMVSNGTAAAGLRSANNHFSGGVATIAPASALPTVTAPLVMDAQTQPGWVLAPIVELNGTGAGSGISGLTLNAAGSVLRGFVINRYAGEGVTTTSGAGLVVQGNYIGTNAAGTAASPNGLSGIWINQSAGGHQIGGTTAAQRNVLSSQTGFQGLAILGGSGHVVQGNHIGTSADGTAALGNVSAGILLYAGVSNSTIGGTIAGAGNLIRSNGNWGVGIAAGATGIAVLGNSIHGNAGLGIDLEGDGITANDGAKTAGRANMLMDSPVFNTATLSGTTLTVAGHVGSAANQSAFAAARVEVFVSDGSFAHGQGQTYLGFLTADASGNFSGTITGVTGVVSGTTRITGTATDGSGNTSEFGANATIGWGISGTVFEDVNYGGGAGRSQATAAGVGLVGATVELYDSAGGWVRSTTTASGGSYSFTGLAAATYHVRVVGGSVQSQRAGTVPGLLGVMTYRTTAASGSAVAVTDQVGGTTPSQADAAAGSGGATFNTSTGVYSAVLTGTAQSFAPVAVSSATVGGVDFGFNFNTVVNTNDAGRGSLRQAITNGNAFNDDNTLAVAGRTAAVEHVIFMLADGTTRPGLRNTFASQFAAGVAALTPTSALPPISSTLVLDAQTQPGWVQDPIVELRGSAAGASAGLTLSGGGSTVRGLIINRYGGHGISVTGGAGHTLQGCWVGTDATGAAAAANAGAGISVSTNLVGLQVGGTSAAQRNVVSGNGSYGLHISSGSGIVVQGNHVGTNATGTAAVGNGSRGVFFDTAVVSATLGGTAAGAGNVISGNPDYAVWLAGGATTVQGNYIGTNAAGTAALANSHGIWVNSSGHLIGGTSSNARNVVSGNTNRGIWMDAGGNTVQGNYVGTNAAGTAALPNSDGIYSKGVNNVIGGSVAGAGNLVSGNSAAGVLLHALADGTTVRGNIIGRNASQSAALPNNTGVSVGCSNGCMVGGTAAADGNVISGNSGAGVSVSAASQGNAILGNAVYGNGGLGIDLNANGLSANDGAKTGGAANQLMDHPVFTSARARGNQLTVAGHVGTAAGQSLFANVRVEVYTSDQDASGHGEGPVYLGLVTTDASGNFNATFTMTQAVLAVGTRLTATATDSGNNTSEFGANFSGLVVDLVVNHNGDAVDANPGDGVCQTATPNQCTLRAALQEVNALPVQPSAPTIAFALPGCSAPGQAACNITPPTALPALTKAAILDGQTQTGWTLAPLVELVGSSAPASTVGLQINAANSVVRGLVVGGFNKAGIGIAANSVLVQGNVVGLQGNGSTPRGNGTGAGSDGGVLVSSGNGVVIGGTTAAQRNVLSGNGGAGLWVDGGTVTVLGNHIGTDAAGASAAGNGRWGIHLTGGSGHVVGGAAAGAGNLVSGNFGNDGGGIYVQTNGTVLLGNRIGTNAAGNGYLPNGDGVSSFGSGIDLRGGSGHVVGGAAPGEANVIAGNLGHGIRVLSQTSRISGNRIEANLWLGIDLGADNVTANNGGVSGAQPNNGMDHPVVTGAGVAGDGNSITVLGFVGTGSGQAVFAGARVEIFKAAPDASGYGEGQTYLGYLTADGSGRFSGTLAVAFGSVVVGDALTATATDAAGNSSEFGPNFTSTTMAGLAPASFNAFETDTGAGALTGVIRSKVAGSAATLAILALDSAGTAPHAGFNGNVQLNWLDARDDSGAATGSCHASWVDLGSAGTATFSNNNRVDVAVTPPASATKAMRLKMTYVGPGGTVVACSNDAFAALPAQLAWLGASDADSASAGTTRTLDNVAATGGVVHQAGRPFTLRAQALTSTGVLMPAYDGTPALAISSCVLPAACTAGALGGGNVAASAGVYTHNTVTYSEVGAVAVALGDTAYGNVDSSDTAIGLRTVASSPLSVGRFVPDSYGATVSNSGVLATANASCLAAGNGATFNGQGFGWATAPQVTVTARNAAGSTTLLWTGSLMKLAPGAGLVPTLAVANAGSATLAASYAASTVQDLGAGQARLQAGALDRFVLDTPASAPQPSTTPTWQWQLAITDSSEAGTAGNPQPGAAATQASVLFDQGGSFHSGRLALATAHGDARSGVRMLMQLQRYTAAGWVLMTEDRGCVTVQRAQLELGAPSGVFVGAGVCAAPLSASATTAGGRAWLALPATPGGATGRLAVRVAGTAATGDACSPAGAVQAVTALGQPWLTGGTTGTGPQALATWGWPQRDLVLRREIW